MTAALSRYAESTPCGFFACVLRIIANSDFGCFSPSMIQSALKILWRQCSEFACANIMSSTSVGSRPAPRSSSPGSRSRRPTARGPARCSPSPAHRGRAPARPCATGASAPVHEQPRGVGALEQRGLGHAIEQRRREPLQLLARERPRGCRCVQTMPRSMRRTASRPHTCAMSVALLDQGEMVPKRGTTMISSGSARVGALRGLARTVGQQSFEQRVHARRDHARGRRSATKRALMAPRPGCMASSAGRSLAMRKSETAEAPGSSII